MSAPYGQFIWYELMTSDARAAEAFYRAVIGWDAEACGPPGIDYTRFSRDGVPVAGLMALPEDACRAGARPGWIGSIAVADVDGTAGRIVEAGGQILRPPEDIPGIGRFAVAADPHGAAFVLLAPLPPEGAAPPSASEAPTPGQIGWRELHAGDLDTAFAFYADLFGWTKDQAIDMGPLGTYQLFAAGGPAIGGMMTKLPVMQGPPTWLYYLMVEGIDAAGARVREAGGQILHEPHQVPGGSWIVQAIDPQGAVFALVAMQR